MNGFFWGWKGRQGGRDLDAFCWLKLLVSCVRRLLRVFAAAVALSPTHCVPYVIIVWAQGLGSVRPQCKRNCGISHRRTAVTYSNRVCLDRGQESCVTGRKG